MSRPEYSGNAFSKRHATAKNPMKQRAGRSGSAECTGQELPHPAEFSAKARRDQVESSSRFRSLIERDLFGKPLHTFPDHALAFALFSAA